MHPKTKSRLEVTGIYLIILIMAVIIFYPLLWTIMMSFNQGTSLFSATLIPKHLSLEHYKWLFTSKESNYLLWYKNSMFVSILNALFSVIITVFTAYAFSRYKFFGRKYGLYLFLLLQMFPVMFSMVALYIFLVQINLANSLWGLLIVYVGGQIPFNAWLVKGYMDASIPRELDEAAKIDGGGHFRIFFSIILPLCKPILSVVALFNFMGPLFDFLLPSIVISDPKKYTLAIGLYNFVNNQFSNNFTRFAAGAILIAIPVAILYLVLQRFLISGLTAGGTKG